MVNLDTHVLIYALRGDLRPRERDMLSRAPWSIAAIVLWELAKLVWPLDLEVARLSSRLDFGGDPADELIAATSIVHGVPLLTRDRNIRRSKMVPLAV